MNNQQVAYSSRYFLPYPQTLQTESTCCSLLGHPNWVTFDSRSFLFCKSHSSTQLVHTRMLKNNRSIHPKGCDGRKKRKKKKKINHSWLDSSVSSDFKGRRKVCRKMTGGGIENIENSRAWNFKRWLAIAPSLCACVCVCIHKADVLASFDGAASALPIHPRELLSFSPSVSLPKVCRR